MIAIVVQTDKLFIEAAAATIDTGAQKEQMQKDLDYFRGFIASISKKLNNEKFVANAKPEVIANERKKMADAQDKVKTLEESLSVM
jgi:valyl-tRNA synthetase